MVYTRTNLTFVDILLGHALAEDRLMTLIDSEVCTALYCTVQTVLEQCASTGAFILNK